MASSTPVQVKAGAAARPASGAARLPAWILLGAVLGLAAGLGLGERTAVFQPLGLAYAKMLEISVFPYLVCSLFVGLGGLARDRAARLLRASWPVYLLLWAGTFLVILLLALVIPLPSAPSLLVPSTAGGGTGLLDLLIPANLALALERNFVPAIVVFALLFAIAIQPIAEKRSFLESMEVLRKASVTIWLWVVYAAPLGVFALFASTAGTIDPRLAGSLVAYMALYLAGTFGMAFVVLPAMLRHLVGMGHREILAELRPALTLALVTTLSAAALPQIQRAAEKLAAARGIQGEEADDVIRASLSIGYVLCQLGNYFIALFVIYLGYHHRVSLSLTDFLLLPPMTLLSGIGSPSASVDAVGFLAQWLGLPDNATDLYVETMTVTRYGQVAVSVMGFAFVTLTVPLVYFGQARYRPRAVLDGLAIGGVLFGAVLLSGLALGPRLFPAPSDARVLARTLDPALVRDVQAVVLEGAALAPLADAGSLEGIRQRGRLRVGYGRDIVPFGYRNAAGQLVGYDVAAAYRLARDLHVSLELVPVDWPTLRDDLEAGRYDLVMAGAYATPERLAGLSASRFYLTSPPALIARAGRAAEFRDYRAVAARQGLRLAVFHDPVLVPLVHALFPQAAIVELGSIDELPAADVDAALWTQAQAAAWTAARTGFTAVVPDGIGTPLAFAYLLPRAARDLARYVDLWLELETALGVRAEEAAYWLAGRPRPSPARRWNILDDVLYPWLDHSP